MCTLRYVVIYHVETNLIPPVSGIHSFQAGKPSTSGLERALKEGCKALCLVPSLEKKKLVAISPESGKAVPFDKCLKVRTERIMEQAHE